MVNSFPIKSHLKKYVLWMLELPEPIQVTERDLLGKAIIKVLQENRGNRNARNQKSLSDMNKRISVILTKEMSERSPRLHRLVNVNVELDNDFHKSIILWIKAQKQCGMPASVACRAFLEVLKIDEGEYSYDAAWQVWKRYNKASKENSPQQAY